MIAVPAYAPPATDIEAFTQTLRELCAGLTPLPGHAPLLDAVRRIDGTEYSLRVSRGGWFRPERIIDGSGVTVAANALSWLESAWAACDEDGAAFAEEYAGSGLILTLRQGVTHYLVAPTGAAAEDFLQIEIEALQEVASHPVGARAVDAVEFLLDRPADAPAAQALGAPVYELRRVTDIHDYAGRLKAQTGKPAPVLRFLDEWRQASAGHQQHFSSHWVLALTGHIDRYRQLRISASPVSAHAPQWQGIPGARGTALAGHLHDFDHAAGYAFAWYFHLVSGHRVPRAVLPEVFADLQDGLAYLPERDAALVHAWMRAPYSI
jgi:hypothetical protein